MTAYNNEAFPGGFAPRCDCGECVLDKVIKIESNIQRNHDDYITWEERGAPFDVPVTTFDSGFYKF